MCNEHYKYSNTLYNSHWLRKRRRRSQLVGVGLIDRSKSWVNMKRGRNRESSHLVICSGVLYTWTRLKVKKGKIIVFRQLLVIFACFISLNMKPPSSIQNSTNEQTFQMIDLDIILLKLLSNDKPPQIVGTWTIWTVIKLLKWILSILHLAIWRWLFLILILWPLERVYNESWTTATNRRLIVAEIENHDWTTIGHKQPVSQESRI